MKLAGAAKLGFLPLLALAAAPIAACANGVGEADATEAALAKDGDPSPVRALSADWKARAGQYMDTRGGMWLDNPPAVGNIRCAMSCHTTFPYLLTSAIYSSVTATPRAADARRRFEERVSQGIAGSAIPFYGSGTSAKVKESHATESILNAAALSFDDLARTGTLGGSAQQALGRMWSQQRADGTWDWLEFGYEPWERGTDFGAGIAALLAGSIPADTTPGQAAGTQRLVGYIQSRLTTMALHDRITALWASSKLTSLLTVQQKESIAAEITRTQLPDGGFSLGAWGRGNLAASVASSSDGYATALATLALCTTTPDGHTRPSVTRSLEWLATHQQANGSWPGQSVNSRSERAKGFQTDAATGYATLAITTCVR